MWKKRVRIIHRRSLLKKDKFKALVNYSLQYKKFKD